MKTQEIKPLKYVGYSIVFQEVPDEVSLVFSISGCPYRCKGCHSPYLWQDNGVFISDDLDDIIKRYTDLITCVCIMGGDQNIDELKKLLSHIKKFYKLKTCLYSGRDDLNGLSEIVQELDYIKIGSYKKEFGGLDSTTTNQRMYRLEDGKIKEDITYKFWRKKLI